MTSCRISEIRFLNVIKALCFFYYLLILPFIWLGKKIWWGLCIDTASKKKSAETAVLKAARKKGPEALEKVGVVSLRAEVEKYQKQHKKHDALKEKIRTEEEKEQFEKKKEQIEEEKEQDKFLEEEEWEATPVTSPPQTHKADEVALDLEFYDDDLWGEDLPDFFGPEAVGKASRLEPKGKESKDQTSKKKDGEKSNKTEERQKRRKSKEKSSRKKIEEDTDSDTG